MENNDFFSQIKTPNRIYTVASYDKGETWRASYRPINKKTGKPWQASRDLRGKDMMRVSNHFTNEKETLAVDPNEIGYPEDWSQGGRYNSAFKFYSSAEVAFKAVYEDAAERGETTELV